MKSFYTPKAAEVINNRFFLEKKSKDLQGRIVVFTVVIQALFTFLLRVMAGTTVSFKVKMK
jgi:hypothetical protein